MQNGSNLGLRVERVVMLCILIYKVEALEFPPTSWRMCDCVWCVWLCVMCVCECVWFVWMCECVWCVWMCECECIWYMWCVGLRVMCVNACGWMCVIVSDVWERVWMCDVWMCLIVCVMFVMSVNAFDVCDCVCDCVSCLWMCVMCECV